MTRPPQASDASQAPACATIAGAAVLAVASCGRRALRARQMGAANVRADACGPGRPGIEAIAVDYGETPPATSKPNELWRQLTTENHASRLT